MGTRVIFLRHGESTYNARGLYQGCSDCSVLTPAGRQAARLTGTFLQNIAFDALYTSPLQRARDTAHYLLTTLAAVPARVEVSSLLREADLPRWEGVPFQTVRECFAADYACWQQRPDEFFMEIARDGAPQRHYPALELYGRLRAFWQEILPRHPDETLLVVAHGGTIRAAIATALGIDPAYYHAIEQSNCALSVLHFPTGEVSSACVESINTTTHLGRPLPKTPIGGLRLLFASPAGSTAAQNLRLLLAGETLNFSLADATEVTRLTARTLTATHPETVRLQLLGADLPVTWQHALQQNQRSKVVTTGLVVAHPAAIATFLSRAIGLRRWRRLSLQPGTLSILHYPADGRPPTLQATNPNGEVAMSLERRASVAACA